MISRIAAAVSDCRAFGAFEIRPVLHRLTPVAIGMPPLRGFELHATETKSLLFLQV
jgi:hypothetical protein